MIVGAYRMKSHYMIGTMETYSWSTYRYKSSYKFLVNYFKDGCPYTLNSLSSRELHCKSGKSRTYHDLIMMAEEHVCEKTFSTKEFNKAFRKLFKDGNLSYSYCPWIADFVFKYHSNSYTSVKYKVKKNKLYLTRYGISDRGPKNLPKSELFNHLFFKVLKAKYKKLKGN